MSQPQPPTLSRWFQRVVATGDAAPRGALVALVLLHVFRDLTLLAGYWGFAAIVTDWVVNTKPGTEHMWWLVAAALFAMWLSQGVTLFLNHRWRLSLLSQLQNRLLSTFARQQHALARQHSSFYWQTMWQLHLPAIVNWHFDYRVQQMVAVIVPVFALVAIFAVNLVVGASLLLTLPVVPVFMILVGKGAAILHRKHFVALERLGTLFVDRLSALPLLSQFTAHDRQGKLLDDAGQRLKERTMKVVSVAFLSTTVLDFFSTLAVALIAVYIGFTLLGEFNLGEDINLHQGLWLLLTAPLLLAEMKKLGQFYHQKAQAEAAREALGDLLIAAAPVTSRADCTFTSVHIQGELTQAPMLRTEGLTLKNGDWIKLKGPSGAGKTVLMEYLSGQRPGLATPLSEYALLTQTPVILPGSVRDNLTLGRAFSDCELHRVIESVGLTDWVSALPVRMDTPMGEYPPISGGQAQRLALARMLLRNPKIWLLDEPTAHLPTEQHDAISCLIRKTCANNTVIWASHKPLPESWFTQQWQIAQGVLSA